jgi:hypothetical protein
LQQGREYDSCTAAPVSEMVHTAADERNGMF